MKKFWLQFLTLIRRYRTRRVRPWSRIDEPDSFLASAEIGVYGMVITALMIMVIVNVLNGSLENMIVAYGYIYTPAEIGVALYILLVLLITVYFVMFRNPTIGDVVEMISDLDANTQERLTEIEKQLEDITRMIRDETVLTVNDAGDDEVISVRMNEVVNGK